MANKRIYSEVDAPTFNTILLGGMTAISTDQGYVHSADSQADGAQGPSDADSAGQKVTFSLTTEDVLQLIPLLISTPTAGEWYGHESGAATYGKGTLVAPVFHSGRFTSQRGSYASISLEGQCRFPDAAATFDDVEGFAVSVAAPTIAHPLRQWQPKSATHDAVIPLHVQALNFAVIGRLIEDYGDTDLGTTAVDVNGYGLVTVELTVRDSTVHAGPPTHDVATALMNNGVKDLIVRFEGVGDTPDYKVTLRNCKWRSKRKAGGRDWTGHTLNGVLQWRDPTGDTVRTINHATPATRLIDFVAA